MNLKKLEFELFEVKKFVKLKGDQSVNKLSRIFGSVANKNENSQCWKGC